MRHRNVADHLTWFNQQKHQAFARAEPMEIGAIEGGRNLDVEGTKEYFFDDGASMTEIGAMEARGRGGNGGGKSRSIICHHCKKAGHIKRECNFNKENFLSFDRFKEKVANSLRQERKPLPSSPEAWQRLYSEQARRQRQANRGNRTGSAGPNQTIQELTGEMDQLALEAPAATSSTGEADFQ